MIIKAAKSIEAHTYCGVVYVKVWCILACGKLHVVENAAAAISLQETNGLESSEL